MRHLIRCVWFSVALLGLTIPAVVAQEPADAGPLAVAGERCPDHDRLRALIGEWDAAVTIWTIPDQPPESASGQATIEEFLDGRFVRTEFTGQFKGQKIEGFGVEGYELAMRRMASVFRTFSPWLRRTGHRGRRR